MKPIMTIGGVEITVPLYKWNSKILDVKLHYRYLIVIKINVRLKSWDISAKKKPPLRRLFT